MPTPNRQARIASQLAHKTTSASASVIAARMRAFADPSNACSPWLLAETQRMGAEKMEAATRGAAAACGELTLLPARLLRIASQPSAWTPSGSLSAWAACAEGWIGVGNAALRPIAAASARNRTRLAKRERAVHR
jgi:hypothetical protein